MMPTNPSNALSRPTWRLIFTDVHFLLPLAVLLLGLLLLSALR